ncbi:MAG: HD domain-containing protein, partial [Xanthomonadales bacterium]|nr:HD domain-containing protein [Xanthomonadales bacterium]
MSSDVASPSPVPSTDVDALLPHYVIDLQQQVESYLTRAQWEAIDKAFRIGAQAHEGQTRKSGEPYITHPVAVARILADMHLDGETLVAAILHDTLEDTHLTKDEVEAEFGSTVADLVDGVTKLDKVGFVSREAATAESFRKMLLAMARDLRVILIKLADRLHNMRTLAALAEDRRIFKSRETLEIYAPIAHRLGINSIKWELE